MALTERLKPLEEIRTALLARHGSVCFLCLSLETGLSVFEVTNLLEGPALAGFVFQKAKCVSCGSRLWCAEYHDIGDGRLLA